LDLLPLPWDDALRETTDGAARPPNYLVSKDLAAAAWVALLLRQPLLLTGDPGVGKTRFAEKLSADLGLGRPETIQIKSTTTGRDLLYLFDDMMRFRDVSLSVAVARSAKGDADPRPLKPLLYYVRLQGLGRAIVRAAGAKAVVRLDVAVNPIDIFGFQIDHSHVTLGQIFPREFEGTNGEPRHTVVLVDELDKAPRDTPNDLLAEVEQMTFRFDELGFDVEAQPAFKPIVVITSNAERNLPDAFLRRCVFHHIDTPSPENMRIIAAARLGGAVDPECPLMVSASRLYEVISEHSSEKKPGTAEFIALVAYLQSIGLTPDRTVAMDSEEAKAALRVIAKTNTDLMAALASLRAVAPKQPRATNLSRNS
jgi:MoxR-like ATPase